MQYELTKRANITIDDSVNEMVELANVTGKPVKIVAYDMEIMMVTPGDNPEVVRSSLISAAVKGVKEAYKLAFCAF